MSADPYDADLVAAVFDYSPITKGVLTEAKIRMISPWSLLGTCLGQAAMVCPWDVRIPAVVGKDATVNLMMFGVGASGAGKGISTAPVLNWQVSEDPLTLPDDEQPLTAALLPITPGSGEGIAALFKENRSVPGIDGKGKITMPVRIRRRAWLDFPEVDQLTAVSSRQGATLAAELRKLWSGEALGTFTKIKANQITVEPYSYRAVVTVSAQPRRCGPILDEAAESGGTLQRILWLSADDPDLELRDDEPGTIDVLPPDFDAGLQTPGPRYFDLDPGVRHQIRQDRADGRWKGTEDSHRNLVRLKVAAAASVLHGSTEISAQAWEWAGHVIEHSVRVRAAVRKELSTAEDEKIRNRAVATSISEVTVASAREAQIEHVALSITKWMRKHPDKTPTLRTLRAAVNVQQRALAPEALELLRETAAVEVAGTSRVGTEMFRLART